MSHVLVGLGIGFAAGSPPFAWLLHAMATGRDLRHEGSGNPGTTNLARSLGVAWALAALALEAGKGAAAVGLARWLAGEGAAVPGALGAVIGHVVSPWLAGRGGKGVATAAGAYLVVAPWAAAAAIAVFTGVLAITRFVSLSSVIAAATLPLVAWLLGYGAVCSAGAAAIALLIAWRHTSNFARMRLGTEPRLGRETRRR